VNAEWPIATESLPLQGRTLKPDLGGADIRQKTFESAVRMVPLAPNLPLDPGLRLIASQLVGSRKSIGAHVEEAQGSHSRKEYIRPGAAPVPKPRETLFSPRPMAASEILPAPRFEDIWESDQIVRIPVAIMKNTRVWKRE